MKAGDEFYIRTRVSPYPKVRVLRLQQAGDQLHGDIYSQAVVVCVEAGNNHKLRTQYIYDVDALNRLRMAVEAAGSKDESSL